MKIPGKKVLLKKNAFNVMMGFAAQHPDNEVVGIIFGTILDSGDIQIMKAYPFRVGLRSEVEFIDEDYEKAVPIIKECQKMHLEWLGWFHSHPFYPGDHLYMSNVDVANHRPAQTMNPFWTAIVINPHQQNDPRTTLGARAFRLKQKDSTQKVKRKVVNLSLLLN